MKNKRFFINVTSTDAFEWLKEEAFGFRQQLEEGAKTLSLFPFLLQDIFYVLYEKTPKMYDKDMMSTGARLNQFVITELTTSTEFKRVRAFAKSNMIISGMAALYFADLVMHSLSQDVIDIVNEIYLTEEELETAVINKKSAEKIVHVAEDAAGQDLAGIFKADIDKWNSVAEDKRKRLKGLSAKLTMLWNSADNKKGAVSGADNQGEKKHGRFMTGVEGKGDNKGVWARGDLQSHLELVHTYLNSPKLKRLAQKVGRLKDVREQRRGLNYLEDGIEVMGIDYGNDLSNVVPEEWQEYLDPVRRPAFKKKFADESLCIYDIKSKRQKSRGSLIICIDNSGSMQGPKEETAKAVALALMEIAVQQKRDFAVIMFGGPRDEMKVYDFPNGNCTFEQLVDIGRYFMCSAGTDFEKPLKQAVRFLEKDKYPGGDIVFITDGVCSISKEFLEHYNSQKKAKKFRTLAVLVNYGQVSKDLVAGFCDEIFWSKDLKGLDIAADLFAKVWRK